MQRQTRGRGTALLIAFVLIAVVAVGLGGRSGTPVKAAAPAGAPLGEVSNGWTLAFSAPAYADGSPFHFYGMTFASREFGLAFGGDTWDGSNAGRVYRTKDGGLTWQLVFENKGWKIGGACSDTSHCWVGGKGGQIYATSNGGDTWNAANEYTWQGMELYPTPPVQTPVPFTAWIRSAAVAPGGSPVLFGATDNTILYSEDGTTFHNYWPMLLGYSATWSVACPSSTTCYGGQTGRWIVKSVDGGHTWDMPAFVSDYTGNCLPDEYPAPPPEKSGIQRRYYGLSFLNTQWGWAVGSCGMIFRTRNGAASRWERQAATLPEIVTLRRVQAYSTKSVLAAGGTNPDPSDPSMTMNAVIYGTTNGDKTDSTWTAMAAPDTDELHGLAGFSDATYVADWSGKIWRWEGELVPIAETPTPSPTDTATSTPTATATATPTATATSTPTATGTPSTGSLEVVAFHDLDGDGQPGQGEALSGAGFRVSIAATLVATGVTGEDGRYTFANLDPGGYAVDETTPPQGYVPTHPHLVVGVQSGSALVLPFPHAANTATPGATAQSHRTWLPLMLR